MKGDRKKFGILNIIKFIGRDDRTGCARLLSLGAQVFKMQPLPFKLSLRSLHLTLGQ